MIDVHILISEDTPKDWVDQCVASVREAIAAAPFEVTLSLVPGVPGHTGVARKLAYAKGTNPYVVPIDDDDWVAPDFFTCFDAEWLEQGTAGVFVREVWVMANGQQAGQPIRHKLAAISRGVVEKLPFERYPRGEGGLVKRAVECDPSYREVEKWVYYRRIGNGWLS